MPSHETVLRAQELRDNMTQGERNVWAQLRMRQVANLKFRRQHPIGPYIADYACISAKLVVEIDGPDHSPAADQIRDSWMHDRGWRVLRFDADDALTNLDWIVECVAKATHPQPLPQAGGG
ncbi:MAG TPA: endonuclease domain-containing protein [Candidatus Dormibacteraeota bacterium]